MFNRNFWEIICCGRRGDCIHSSVFASSSTLSVLSPGPSCVPTCNSSRNLAYQGFALKLSAPFGRQIAEPLDTFGQMTFYGRFDKIGLEAGERNI
jgi:hypothetical protein